MSNEYKSFHSRLEWLVSQPTIIINHCKSMTPSKFEPWNVSMLFCSPLECEHVVLFTPGMWACSSVHPWNVRMFFCSPLECEHVVLFTPGMWACSSVHPWNVSMFFCSPLECEHVLLLQRMWPTRNCVGSSFPRMTSNYCAMPLKTCTTSSLSLVSFYTLTSFDFSLKVLLNGEL